uniref:G_PROTEIN_RECEP_F1_2 domain-containing protein n=1 Tax=Caenorhabditis japonica TaxID=281687 RepID=A0A8R1EJ48_CAEJA
MQLVQKHHNYNGGESSQAVNAIRYIGVSLSVRERRPSNILMENVEVQQMDRIAAIVIFLTSFVGFVCNTFIACYIKRLSLLRNSFGRLLQLQAAGDAVFVLVWAFYFAPVLFFPKSSKHDTLFSDIKPLQSLGIAARLAQLCLVCYDISIYTHLVISLNRFISLYFPTSYQTIFTERFTTIIVCAIVLVSFAFSWFLVIVELQSNYQGP